MGCLPTRVLVTAAAAGAWAAIAEPANVPRAEATMILIEPGERPSDSAIACAFPLAAVSSSSVTGVGVATGSSRFARFEGRVDPSATTRTRGAAARALAVLTPALRRPPARPFCAPVRPVFTIQRRLDDDERRGSREQPSASRRRFVGNQKWSKTWPLNTWPKCAPPSGGGRLPLRGGETPPLRFPNFL
jgi:hypothetical protein